MDSLWNINRKHIYRENYCLGCILDNDNIINFHIAFDDNQIYERKIHWKNTPFSNTINPLVCINWFIALPRNGLQMAM